MARRTLNALLLACLFVTLQLSIYVNAKMLRRICPTNTANNTYAQSPLPLPYDGYLPAIDNETMWLHYNRHAGGAVTAVNAILARYQALQPLPLAYIVQQIGMSSFTRKYNISANDITGLRNNAGSMINHAIFWRIMTRYNSSTPANGNITDDINRTWGSPKGMLDALRTAANSLFGSGWAWLVYQPTSQSLKIVTTPNQDNPLMRRIVPGDVEGVPLMGVDVWEHAYYLKYRNVRASYTAMWVNLIDWQVLERNYNLARRGYIDGIYC